MTSDPGIKNESGSSCSAHCKSGVASKLGWRLSFRRFPLLQRWSNYILCRFLFFICWNCATSFQHLPSSGWKAVSDRGFVKGSCCGRMVKKTGVKRECRVHASAQVFQKTCVPCVSSSCTLFSWLICIHLPNAWLWLWGHSYVTHEPWCLKLFVKKCRVTKN